MRRCGAYPFGCRVQPTREDGRQELYRVAFIAFTAEPLRQRRLAVGAFNCRVAEGQA